MDSHDTNQLYAMLGEIKASQQHILEGMKRHFEDDKEAFYQINERIRSLESKINMAAGVISILVLVFSVSSKWFLTKVGLQ